MLAPLQPKEWDLAKAAHLLNRAGFGGTPDEIKAFQGLGFEKAVEQILNGPDDSAQFPKPEWAAPRNVLEMRREARMLPEEERQMNLREAQKNEREHVLSLVHWWLGRMRKTPNPLREKMTLFWHGHFATSIQKVKQVYLMWQQNETLRANALGNFGTLLKAVSRDPAMIFYLDTQQSRLGKPNENFAREVMELFTLGIGNYTEEDIREAARAFTCYKIDQRDQSFRLAPRQQDDGEKKFFGQTGNFSGDDILDLILKKPACAKFIGNKLWEFFAYEDPSPALLELFGKSFRERKYEIKPLMREMFRSAEFYSSKAIRTQIKSPVQWLVGTAKILDTEIPPPLPTSNALRQLGQTPFAPPNVKGWDGGKAWITTSTLLLRYNLSNYAVGTGSLDMQRRVSGGNHPNRRTLTVQNRTPLEFGKIVPQAVRDDPKRLIAYLSFRLYQTYVSPHDAEPFLKFLEERKGEMNDDSIRELLHLMMSTPQYQLT